MSLRRNNTRKLSRDEKKSINERFRKQLPKIS